MKRALNRLLAFSVGLALVVPIVALADWYEATGKPVQRSLLNSADLRSEFALIESNISDKLPVLTGNGSKIVAVNSAGTALEALSAGVPVASGGTGATTAAGARTNLGLAIGSDVQAFDADLGAIAAINKTDGNFIVGNGTTWIAESGATARASLGLGSLAVNNSINNSLWSGTDLAIVNGGTGASDASTARSNLGLAIGSDVQAFDADLSAIAALAKTDGNFIVGNGSAWVAESGSTARASLGLGSLATLSTVNNGNWSGTDLAIANGGTGASDAATARSNLGLGSLATLSSVGNAQITDVSAAKINAGTLSDARLSSNVPLRNAVNLFTQVYTAASVNPGIELASISPAVAWDETDASADEGRWDALSFNGRFFIRAVSDDGATTTNVFEADRTGMNSAVAVTGTTVVKGGEGGFLYHDNTSNTGGKVIITNVTPSDTTGMNPGDIKLVY